MTSTPKAGEAGTATVTLSGHSKRVRGMWQKRTDGVLFFVLAEPFRSTVSAHHLYVTDFEKEVN